MRLLWVLVFFLAVVNAGVIQNVESESSTKVRYDNYKVFKLNFESKKHEFLVTFIQQFPEKFNIWKEYDEVSKEMHVMVSPSESETLVNVARIFGVEAEIVVENVQKLIDEEEKQNNLADNVDFGWTRYYQLHEINAWLDSILEAYPSITKGFDVGESYEGRTIRGIKIAYKPNNPAIFIESNIHAREWITSASATWFIKQLLTSNDPEVRNLAESYNWYIVPVFNVDGFVYSHVTDRMWRKTRQPVQTSNCIGTDANRNFNSHWMANGGASDNPCSETYAGPAPFSEPEAKGLSQFLTQIKDDIKIYLSFHSYGQYLLSPYGHTATEFPENYNDLLTIGEAFASSIENLKYATPYTYGSTATALYVASGSSVDWVFNELDVKIGYTIEFRDKGRFGFVLPPVNIIPNCEELMAGMKALVGKAAELKYI